MGRADTQIGERITPLQSLVCAPVPVPESTDIIKDTTTGEVVRILSRPDEAQVKEKLQALWDKGIRSVAVAFVHSYLWNEHEEFVAKIARDMGFQVSVSSDLQPMVRHCLPRPIIPQAPQLCCFGRL